MKLCNILKIHVTAMKKKRLLISKRAMATWDGLEVGEVMEK